jgi:DivIVA domain-containing protein
MRFTPEEIEVKEFVTRFRGYDREEVQAFLRLLADDVRRLGVEPQLDRSSEVQLESLINAHSMALNVLLEMVQRGFESWDDADSEMGRVRTQAWVARQALETLSRPSVRLPETIPPKSIAAPDGFPPARTSNDSQRSKLKANAENARSSAGLEEPNGMRLLGRRRSAGSNGAQPAAAPRRLTRGIGAALLAIQGVVAVLTLLMALFFVRPSAAGGAKVLVSVLTLSGLLIGLGCISCLPWIISRTNSRVESRVQSHRQHTQSEDDLYSAFMALPGRTGDEPSRSGGT